MHHIRLPGDVSNQPAAKQQIFSRVSHGQSPEIGAVFCVPCLLTVRLATSPLGPQDGLPTLRQQRHCQGHP